MTELTETPEPLVSCALRGALKFGVPVFLSVGFGLVFRVRQWSQVPMLLGIALAASLASALIGVLYELGRALLYRWAYERAFGAKEPWND